MDSVWAKRSNRSSIATPEHFTSLTHPTSTTSLSTSSNSSSTSSSSTTSTKLIQLQRTSSPNGTSSISSVLLSPTTPLVASASGYLSKSRGSIVEESKEKDKKESGASVGGIGNIGPATGVGIGSREGLRKDGTINGSNGVVALNRQQYIPSPTSDIHPLHFTWVFWFMHRAPGSKITNYEQSMKKIAAFSSIEDFWAVYSHLRRPHGLPNISDYHLFKQGVRPVWEDVTNINGGKWIVRLRKGLASRYWESLVMAVIGDQFDVGTEICGAVLSIRSSEDILSLWNQSAREGRINLKIRDTMKRVLNLPPDTIMEYKSHTDAMKDNSSFRNTDVFR